LIAANAAKHQNLSRLNHGQKFPVIPWRLQLAGERSAESRRVSQAS